MEKDYGLELRSEKRRGSAGRKWDGYDDIRELIIWSSLRDLGFKCRDLKELSKSIKRNNARWEIFDALNDFLETKRKLGKRLLFLKMFPKL